ncbi:hypothetical protein F2Q69_00055003 [Brassica cretica]|uniref:Uncharacterized protein n=1 Tax=Brassica cretica TaxID=69181 RepID=A0A8S9MY78_BRACR|nr:hypothetical protein F2Q69_00055003 [Brassica cretica]
MIPYVTGTCHIIIGKGNGGDASSFHLLSFLSFGFSVSTTTKAIPLALGGSSLVDSSAAPRRRLLSSRKEKCDVSIDGFARGKMTAIWVESGGDTTTSKRRYMSGSRRTIQVQDKDKRRLLLRLMKRNAFVHLVMSLSQDSVKRWSNGSGIITESLWSCGLGVLCHGAFIVTE